jgi:hypothetical protein
MHAQLEEDNGLVMQRHTNGWSNEFALKNYSRAINILVEPLFREGQPAIDVCLICSILFACLEVSRSHNQTSRLLIGTRRCRVAGAPLLHTSKAA